MSADVDNWVEEETAAAAPLNGTQPAPPVAEPFEGLSHAEALAENIAKLPGGQLVDELVERGTVGTIAGIPETHKTWLAQAIAVGVARGDGQVLGQDVLEQASVGYFWQDDSRRNELERIQTFARARDTPPELPMRWFLNLNLRLPDELERLRATVEHWTLALVVLDSFYNIAGAVAGKDREAGALFAAIKTDVCDPTGCAVLIVDHAPWPTDSNRGQMRGYGDVHKGAAVRWGIYLQRDRGKLYVEARGNNVRGLKRTPAYWHEETLELRLVEEPAPVANEEYEQRILDHLADHPWATTDELEHDVEGRGRELRKARQRLEEAGRLTSAPSAEVGRPGKGKRWNPSNEAASNPVPLFADGAGRGTAQAVTNLQPRPPVPHPVGGTGLRTDGDENERPAASADDEAPISEDAVRARSSS